MSELADGDQMDGVVEHPVTPRVEPMPLLPTGGDFDGCCPVVRGIVMPCPKPGDVAGVSNQQAGVTFDLPNPQPDRLRLRTQLVGNRTDRLPLRPILGLVLRHQPDRPLRQLVRILPCLGMAPPTAADSDHRHGKQLSAVRALPETQPDSIEEVRDAVNLVGLPDQSQSFHCSGKVLSIASR